MAGVALVAAKAGWTVSFAALAVVAGLLFSLGPGAATLTVGTLPEADGGESTWQGTWYTLVDTGSGPECVGEIGADSWSSTFAKDWGTDDVFGVHSDNVCFLAGITICVRQSGAYRFDLRNVDDGARLFDAGGNLLFDAVCGFLNCPTQNGMDVNLQEGKTQLRLQFWEFGGRASISFLAADKSIFSNTAPTVSFTYSPSAVFVDDPVSFSAIALDPDVDSIGYSWNIGTSSYFQRDPTHTFRSPGTYRVTLLATDEFGASASAGQDIVVRSESAGPSSGVGPFGFSDSVFYAVIAVVSAAVVGMVIVQYRRIRRRRAPPPLN